MLLRSCKKKSINLANSRKINVKLRACLILLALLPSFFSLFSDLTTCFLLARDFDFIHRCEFCN
jgi:hypothetical protein